MNHNELAASATAALFGVEVPNGLVGDSSPLAVVRDWLRILFAQAEKHSGPKMTYIMTDWTRIEFPERFLQAGPRLLH